MTIEDFKSLIVDVFRNVEFTEEESRIIFNIYDQKWQLENDKLNHIENNLLSLSIENNVGLYNAQSYEILVRNNSRVIYSRDREHSVNDEVNKITYSISKASDEFLIQFITVLLTYSSSTPIKRYFDSVRIRKLGVGDRNRESIEQLPLFYPSILEALKDCLPRFDTLKINSELPLRKNQFENYSFSYLFSLSYNLSYSIYPLRNLEEFVSPLRTGLIRRSSPDEIEPPKRVYNNDLILHYQKGISSDNLDHQYLSFYHILEHFFGTVYNDDVINKVKNEITQPGFSYKRNKDIESLIKLIQHRLKYKNDEFLINELEALELTLRKYLPIINEIKNELFVQSSVLIDYFKSTEVSFSKGNKVNFDVENEDEIYRNLSKRIYMTRNAIVHSKEAEKVKYLPFRDDKDLIPEVLLMRILTERVIINNSKEI